MGQSKKMFRGGLAALAGLAFAAQALAVEPDEILADARLEARARALSVDLRCLVCQNQSIDDSNAPLARDLRLLVRERLKAGDTDADVMTFVVARYGDFVLLRPPLNWKTWILWISAPLLLLLVGGLMWRAVPRAGRSAASNGDAPALSEAEEKKLQQILGADAVDVSGQRRS